MDIPGVGSPRGILEVFLPGLFLLFNLVLAGFFLNPDDVTRNIMAQLGANVGPSLVAAVPIGYCLGVALRLLRTRTADTWSGWTIRVSRALSRTVRAFFGRSRSAQPTAFALRGDNFPYPEGFRDRVQRSLPTSAMDFYAEIWLPPSGRASLSRFDFLKAILGELSSTAATEMYAAEALCRYVANTVYSITISIGFIFAALLFSALHGRGWPLALLAPLTIYSLAVVVILANFRYLRMYEVEKVFALAFRYRVNLAGVISAAPSSAPVPPSP